MTSTARQPGDTADRFILLERCPNFRDLGGYTGMDGRTVRWRQLFRSMTPEYLLHAEAGAAGSLGIRLVIDLRGLRARNSGLLAMPPVRRLRVGQPRTLAKTRAELTEYAHLRSEEALPVVLHRFGRTFAKAASAIADEPGPTLVHCRLGKDRTGVFSAVVLNTLGVSDRDVVEDCMLSNEHLNECHELLEQHEGPTGAARSRVAREPANRAAIQEVLRLLNGHYGGGAAYLRFHGMNKRGVIGIRERLLE